MPRNLVKTVSHPKFVEVRDSQLRTMQAEACEKCLGQMLKSACPVLSCQDVRVEF